MISMTSGVGCFSWHIGFGRLIRTHATKVITKKPLPESLAGGSAENVTIEELANFTINDLSDIEVGEGFE